MQQPQRGTYKQLPYWRLRAKFRECGMYDAEVAQAAGLAQPTLSRRMQGARPWLSSEIRAICKVLGIPRDEIGEYFFPEMEEEGTADER